MKKLVLTTALVMMMIGANAQAVDTDSIVDGEKLEKYVKMSEGDRLPQFRNGQADLFRWLSFNVKYPKEAQKYKVEGRVIVTFVVERDGSVSHVKPVKSQVHFLNKEKSLTDTGMDETAMTNYFGNLFQDEARRVLSSMPKWKPGIQFGKPVRVKYTVPLTFARP